ncbi:HTH domain-containing protein, partial [Staphylococcus sp. IPLA37011]
MKSISQLSTELNVSRTTIWNYLQNLPQNLSVIKEKNVYKIDIDVENFIRERLLK